MWMPLPSRRATRNWPSSGPRMNSSMLFMPIVGRLLAGKTHRNLDVHWTGLLLDHLQAAHRHLPGQFVVGPRRRPESQHELARIDLRKQFAAQLAADHAQHQRANDHVAPTTAQRHCTTWVTTRLETLPGHARRKMTSRMPYRAEEPGLRFGSSFCSSSFAFRLDARGA